MRETPEANINNSVAPEAAGFGLKNSLIVLVAFVVIGGAYVYFQQKSPSNLSDQTAKNNQDLQNARASFAHGDVQTAVQQFQTSLANATDKTQEAIAKISLASSLIQAGSPLKGIQLLKEASLDTSYFPMYRANAALFALEYFMGGKDTQFARQNIFTGPTWGAFLQASSSSPESFNVAIRNALQWMISLSPSFSSQYVLAYYYAQDIAANPSFAALAKQQISSGDVLYKAALTANDGAKQAGATGLPPYSNNTLGVALEHKALALDYLYRAKKSVSVSDIEQAYKDTIVLLESDPTQKFAMVSGLYTRYHYAALLLQVDPVANKAEIVSTLAPIDAFTAEYQNENFYQGFLKLYGTDPSYKHTPMWNDMVGLAKIDASFKSLLTNLGWSATSF